MTTNLENYRLEREYEQALDDLRQFVIDETLAGRPIVIVIEKPTIWERIKSWFGRG